MRVFVLYVFLIFSLFGSDFEDLKKDFEDLRKAQREKILEEFKMQRRLKFGIKDDGFVAKTKKDPPKIDEKNQKKREELPKLINKNGPKRPKPLLPKSDPRPKEAPPK